jgi:hypothetical protein
VLFGLDRGAIKMKSEIFEVTSQMVHGNGSDLEKVTQNWVGLNVDILIYSESEGWYDTLRKSKQPERYLFALIRGEGISTTTHIELTKRIENGEKCYCRLREDLL